MTNIRATPASEYDLGEGFVIEQCRHWNFNDEPSWAIPAWEEMGCDHLSGVFPTRSAAEAAILDT
jgi:hypothetical protein